MAADPSANGYWLVDALGNVTAYGAAQGMGSIATPFDLNAQISGIAPTNDGNGYWLVSRDGGVFAFGDAPFEGSTGGQQVFNPVIALVATHDGNGYWLLTNSPVPPPGVPMLGRGLPGLDEEGFGLVAPTSTFDGGDPAGATGSIAWDSWGGSEATGTGIALDALLANPKSTARTNLRPLSHSTSGLVTDSSCIRPTTSTSPSSDRASTRLRP